MVNIDLNFSSNFGKLDFSPNNDKKYKEIFDQFTYNPKLYNNLDRADDVKDSYTGTIDDLRDTETKIIYKYLKMNQLILTQ